MRSADSSARRFTRSPLTNVPCRLPASSTTYSPLFRHDARVVARGAAVAHDQVVIRLAADAEGQRLEFDAHAMARGIHDDQGRRLRRMRGAWASHQSRTLTRLATAGSARAPRFPRLFHFLDAQRLAMRAVAAHLGPRQQDLKSEVALDLLAQPLQRLAEELLHLAAAQADHVRVLLLHAGFVVVLVAAVVHQVQLVHQAAVLEHLQRAVDGDAVELGILLLGQLKQALGVQVLAGLVDQIQQDLPLPGEPHALLLEGSLDGRRRHRIVYGNPQRRISNAGCRARAASLLQFSGDVPQGPDRQSRRDRRPHHAHAARDGDRLGGRLFRRRPHLAARAHGG